MEEIDREKDQREGRAKDRASNELTFMDRAKPLGTVFIFWKGRRTE